MKTLQTINKQLTERGYVLAPYCKDDFEKLYEIYHEVITAGTNYPNEVGSREEFQEYFFVPGSWLYVCKSAEEVVGGFYLKPNFPGRAKHIANAAYMLANSSRGMGLGALLVEASLSIAKEKEFKAMQFNLVLSQNKAAVNLYKKLGFTIIGTIPHAIRNPDNSYQDGYIMYYSF